MNNRIIYFDKEVPEYYVKGSRDFQALARLLTFALNSAKVEADSLLYLNDPILISNNLLALMQTKVGFWTNYTFTDDDIRLVCDCFNLAVREKGSRNGIVKAIEIFLRTINAAAEFDILIQNKDSEGNDQYRIEIGINDIWNDYTLLEEILRYILPTGYILTVYYYDLLKFVDKSLLYSDYTLYTPAPTYGVSKVRNQYYSSTTGEWKYLGAKRLDVEALKFPYVDFDTASIPPTLLLEGHPDSQLRVGSNKLIVEPDTVNVSANDSRVCIVRAVDDEYNGIQSIDMTIIYQDTGGIDEEE